MPLVREVKSPVSPWPLRLFTFWLAFLMWLLCLSTFSLLVGCWTSGAQSPCPPGAVSTGGASGSSRCEPVRKRTARYPRCDKLSTLVGRLATLDTSECMPLFDDKLGYADCMWHYFENRNAMQEWRWTTAISYCAPETP